MHRSAWKGSSQKFSVAITASGAAISTRQRHGDTRRSLLMDIGAMDVVQIIGIRVRRARGGIRPARSAGLRIPPHNSPENVQYRGAGDSVLHIYLSPEHVGKSTETLASWGVDDIERVVDELTRRGVTFEGDAKVAYFKDPDGHTLSIAQSPRS